MLQNLSRALAAYFVVILLIAFNPGMTYGQEAAKPNAAPPEKAAGQEFPLRGQRAAREIKYSDWRKVCFKVPGTNTVCRTSIVGTFVTGQTAVRIDLTEREGDATKRLRLFLPVGLYLQAGVTLAVDQGTAVSGSNEHEHLGGGGQRLGDVRSLRRIVRAGRVAACASIR